MNIPQEKADLCQISLTGVRSLAMLGLLIQAPRTLEEIREKFLSCKYIDAENSNDIIRIDMNTLRAAGCDISRLSSKTNHKYELYKHPFGLQITGEEIKLLKRAYNILKDGADITTLIKYHLLFKKMAKFVFDSGLKERLLGISDLKSYDIDKMKELEKDCKCNNILTLEYRDGVAYKITKKNILAQKVAIRSGKIYLFGVDVDSQLPVMFPIKRIKSIISKQSGKNAGVMYEPVKVKFFLKNFNAAGLEDCETVIESHDDMSYTLTGEYHNEFLAVQRMLALGSECVVLEPASIKQKVIEKLLAMREIYKNG